VTSGAGASASQRCDFMSREDMRMCQVNKPGADARSPLCDQVSSHLIESCLQQAGVREFWRVEGVHGPE